MFKTVKLYQCNIAGCQFSTSESDESDEEHKSVGMHHKIFVNLTMLLMFTILNIQKYMISCLPISLKINF